jgi:hypothetical protein
MRVGAKGRDDARDRSAAFGAEEPGGHVVGEEVGVAVQVPEGDEPGEAPWPT